MTTIEHEELEYLSGKLINGNDTVVLFSLIKEPKQMAELLNQLTGETYIRREIVHESPKSFNLDDWFKGGVLIKEE